MTHAPSVLEGWHDPVTQIRTPHWLDRNDRAVLAETIIDLLNATSVFPTVRARLDAVLTELGVAEARDQVWPVKSEIMRRAHGLSADVLPIRMCSEELETVLTIPTLPTALRSRLAGTPEKK